MLDRVRDVVLLSRVRLARNLADLPFPAQMQPEQAETALLRAANALAREPVGQDYTLHRIEELPGEQSRALAERRVISPELLEAGPFAAVLIRRDEAVSILLNEEDHLRIHALLPGLALEEAAMLAFAVDEAIGRHLRYAFDAEWGFLTSCPANTGTGMRATALLHLPAMTHTGAIGELVRELAKVNVQLRPFLGEKGNAKGELYLLGNQVSLGITEEELLGALEAVLDQIVDRERAARELMLVRDDGLLKDRLLRSVGILQNAQRLGETEWVRRWSDLRLAVQAGWFSMDLSALDALLDAAKPAHLEIAAGHELTPAERDAHRAEMMRAALG
ncbi:MAG: ATP--guanido phosphotransferase [Oscillospiraceae bacterium]|jgi:protein arginine kinase|nr:ATP--guanido phosphotransferase [Oscillospiraceae bacterium]